MSLALLETIAVIAAGMMAGNELCVGIINANLRKQDEHTRFTSGRAFAALFGAFMPFWYAATLLLAGAVAFSLRASGTAAVLADVSALLWLLSIVYTVAASSSPAFWRGPDGEKPRPLEGRASSPPL